jgi:hypothetical protein
MLVTLSKFPTLIVRDKVTPAVEPLLLALNVAPFALSILVTEFVRMPNTEYSSLIWFFVCWDSLLQHVAR